MLGKPNYIAMSTFYILIKFGVIISPILFLVFIAKVNYLIHVTNKNHNSIMAQLTDFQQLASEINTATQNISAYVQGAGMSAAEQDEALVTIKNAVAGLTAAIPHAAPGTEQQG